MMEAPMEDTFTIFLAVGAGAGLAVAAGVRAFLPLAVFMFLARMDWVWGYSLSGGRFDFLQSDAAVYILLALVVLEIILTRVSPLRGLERMLRLPASTASGALLMAAAMAVDVPGYWGGLAVGALLALVAVYVHRGLLDVGGGKDPGIALDLSVLVLALAVMLAPPAGYIAVLFVGWLALRVRRLRRRKYKGLRILA
jgi:hypothetical protein